MSEWISVRDRVPKPNTYVVTRRTGDVVPVVAVMTSDERWWEADLPGNETKRVGVDYWVPLPESPMMKEEIGAECAHARLDEQRALLWELREQVSGLKSQMGSFDEWAKSDQNGLFALGKEMDAWLVQIAESDRAHNELAIQFRQLRSRVDKLEGGK